jgi:uncharacterized membrane protein
MLIAEVLLTIIVWIATELFAGWLDRRTRQ